MASSQDIAQALRYGPQVAQVARRSAYLEDALKQMATPQESLRSPWELAARLAGVAIASRSADKARGQVDAAVKSAKDDRLARMLANLPDPAAQRPAPPTVAAAPPPQAPQAAPQAAPPQQAAMQPAVQAPVPQPAPTGPTSYRDAIAGIESRGSGDYAALGPVTRTGDRAYGRYQIMGANLPQWTREALGREVGPDEFLADPKLQDAVFDHRFGSFVEKYGSPEEAASVWFTGRPRAQGADRRDQLGTSGADYVQRFSEALGPQPGPDAQPFEIAANGPLQPGMIPSPSDRSPPADGAPPAATPQAAAGGMPVSYQPTAQEVLYVKRLMSSPDPEDQARGEAAYWKLMEKMVEPQKWESITVNGLPGQQNPYSGEVRLSEIPQAARTQTVASPEGLTPGTVVQQKPTGEMSVLQAPPSGYQGNPAQQSYIRGGPNDPAAGANLVANEGKLRDDYAKEIAPYVGAREGYQKVVQAAGDMSQAGAIALVFGYMKTLDPGSTVREGEAATVQNSGTIPQTITNMYNKLIAGESSLSPAQREQFANSAKGQFSVYQKTFDAANQRYGDLARSYGFEPGRVVRQFDEIAPFKAPPVQKQPSQVQLKALQSIQGYDKALPLGDAKHPFVAVDAATLQALDTPANRGKWIVGPDGRLGQFQ